MASGFPTTDLWPQLRRRIKGCKSKKGKSKLGTCSTRGVEKLSVIYAELQARRDLMVEKMGAQVSMVRSMSKSLLSRYVDPNHFRSVKSSDFVVCHVYEEGASTFNSDSVSAVDTDMSESDRTVNVGVDNVDLTDQACGSMKCAAVDHEKRISNSDDLAVFASGTVESSPMSDRSVSHSCSQLEVRGGKGVSTRKRFGGRRESRWKLVDRTTVVFIIVLTVVAEKTSNLAVSILGVLYLGVVAPCRSGKQCLPGITRFLQGLLFSHLSALATKRLDLNSPQVEKKIRSDTDQVSSHHPTQDLPNSRLCSPVASPHASPSFCRVSSVELENITSASLVQDLSAVSAASSEFTSQVDSPSNHLSYCPGPEKGTSPSKKLSQFRSKLMKSFHRTKTESDNKDHVFTVSLNDLNQKPGSQGDRLYSHPKSQDSCSSIASGEPEERSTRESVAKKKSFLQRRSSILHGDGESEISSGRTSSFSRSRFANLRVSVSHSHDVFDTAPTAGSPHTLRIGSLRISASMKDSPRKSLDLDSSKPCSPGSGKPKSNKMDGMRRDHATPRLSGLGVPSPSPSIADLHEARKLCELKKCHKHEAWVAVIFLVALLFLLVGRASAVLATTISFMFLSQLEKFKNSEGAGWDRDASRRSMSISRKLKTSSYLSPHIASPRTPSSPCTDHSRPMTPAAYPNECRRSTTIDRAVKRSNTMDHIFRRSTNF